MSTSIVDLACSTVQLFDVDTIVFVIWGRGQRNIPDPHPESRILDTPLPQPTMSFT